ncbi:MAG: hypothetical protein JWO57_925 [Pseudonocardiales bacterium]|nr:hypothetical protein [Pseudonocardiales bacterium]
MQLQVRRRVRAQAPFLAIVLIVVACFVYMSIEPGHWRRGTGALGCAMLLAGLLRATLPATHIGLLAIRGRWWDTLCYLALGALILIVDIRLRH